MPQAIFRPCLGYRHPGTFGRWRDHPGPLPGCSGIGMWTWTCLESGFAPAFSCRGRIIPSRIRSQQQAPGNPLAARSSEFSSERLQGAHFWKEPLGEVSQPQWSLGAFFSRGKSWKSSGKSWRLAGFKLEAFQRFEVGAEGRDHPSLPASSQPPCSFRGLGARVSPGGSLSGIPMPPSPPRSLVATALRPCRDCVQTWVALTVRPTPRRRGWSPSAPGGPQNIQPADGRTMGHLDYPGGDSRSGPSGSILKTGQDPGGAPLPPLTVCRPWKPTVPLWGGRGHTDLHSLGGRRLPKALLPPAPSPEPWAGRPRLHTPPWTPVYPSRHPQAFKRISVCFIFR